MISPDEHKTLYETVSPWKEILVSPTLKTDHGEQLPGLSLYPMVVWDLLLLLLYMMTLIESRSDLRIC